MNESIKKIKKGTQYVEITSEVTKTELTEVNHTDFDINQYSTLKFIPASGAATRMFKNLYTYRNDQINTDFIHTFFNQLKDFAFYEELSSQLDIDPLDLEKTEDRLLVINQLLTNKMNYGSLPKALLKFHQYEDCKTPIDEHIFEGENYLNLDKIKLHFTISPEHEELFLEYVNQASKNKENLDITYSFQKPETQTLAADLNNEPFIQDNGEVLYRPGGHGSLIENLNDLEEDIIFIKNIDNVCHQHQAKDTITSKKQLAIAGVEVKNQIDQYVSDLVSDSFDLDEISQFIEDTLNITYKKEMTKEVALKFLNRPLRVCGVVKNQGDPGGGPYIVDNGDYLDLQICEEAEIDVNDEHKKAIMSRSKYFNPVDLVCFTKDYEGKKFNLLNYVNENRYFVTEKSREGRPVKALEHPGLWNGAMHDWNTLFVEVPATTFNPVKNVNDLLKEGHQSKSVKSYSFK